MDEYSDYEAIRIAMERDNWNGVERRQNNEPAMYVTKYMAQDYGLTEGQSLYTTPQPDFRELAERLLEVLKKDGAWDGNAAIIREAEERLK